MVLLLCPLWSLWDLTSPGLVFCMTGIQNKTSQSSWAKRCWCQRAMSHMPRDSMLPWEKDMMFNGNVRLKSSILPFRATREAKYSPLCITMDIKVRVWKGGGEFLWISPLTELGLFYKWVGKASGKICPYLAPFLSNSFPCSFVQ